MPRPPLRRLAVLLALIPPVAAAEPRPAAPSLETFFPPVVVAGATTLVTAAGKFADWPPVVWTDAPGIVLRPEKESGELSVEIAADTVPGPHLVRFINASGASVPRFLLVTTEPPLAETEPNDDPARAQSVPALPAVITGRLGKTGDVDCYALELPAGRTLTAILDAQVIASPVDAALRLLDARGVEVAFNHDNGRNLDPLLTFTPAAGGRFTLQVFGFAHPATAEVRLHGSDAAVYRLILTTGTPPAPEPSPAEGPLFRRAEYPKEAPQPPFAAEGVISRPREESLHPFTVTKGDKLVLSVQAAALGSPLDAWVAMRDSAGKELARNDDGANTGADPFLEWKAPADGTYTAVVGNLLHRGGADHSFRLVVRPAHPRLEAVITDAGCVAEPGKSAEIKVTLRRLEGFKGALVASVAGLPDCVSASEVTADDKQKEITLTVKAPADAAPFHGLVEVRLREAEGAGRWTAVHELVSTTLNNGVPQGYRDLLIRSTPGVWFTVTPPGPAEKPEKKKK
ncbi:MAG: PPC domain-containing protein [Opitutaceae bacterium]